MGGRGSGSSTGGGGGGSVAPQATQQTQFVPIVDPNTQPVDGLFGITKADLVAMSDDEFADFLDASQRVDMPVWMDTTSTQKLIFSAGLNDKPQVMDDKSFNQYVRQNGSKLLYRTVNADYDSTTDLGISAVDICDQMKTGSLTRTGRGTAMGDGFYFADSKRDSRNYGHTTGNIQKTAIMTAVLAPGARGISESQISNLVHSEIRRGTKLGQALQRAGHRSGGSGTAYAEMAIRKGYDYITWSSAGYYNVVNRGALIVREGIEAK